MDSIATARRATRCAGDALWTVGGNRRARAAALDVDATTKGRDVEDSRAVARCLGYLMVLIAKAVASGQRDAQTDGAVVAAEHVG